MFSMFKGFMKKKPPFSSETLSLEHICMLFHCFYSPTVYCEYSNKSPTEY